MPRNNQSGRASTLENRSVISLLLALLSTNLVEAITNSRCNATNLLGYKARSTGRTTSNYKHYVS